MNLAGQFPPDPLPPPPTILIVEDVDPAASTLEIALAKVRGVRIAAVYRAEAAWSYLNSASEGQVCALVTDLHMPGMDGFELIERVRSDERYTRLPIIVISGCSDPRTPTRVAELGADAFFEKPYSPVRVRTTLEQLLHEHHFPTKM